MILTDEDVDRIVRTSEGSLEEVPFAVLLYALARADRSVTLEIKRQPLAKEILVESGVPVRCSSNLAHETLSRFMQRTGRLDAATANECFAEACSKGVRFGDVLIARGLIGAEDLLRVLQQNLARKLLDVFSWHHGSYRLSDFPPEVDSTLRVNLPQLIVLGVTRFATQDQVDGAIGPLIGKALALHPSPVFPLDDLRLRPQQRSVLDALVGEPKRIDELAAVTGVPFSELTRTLYALTLIGGLLPADQVPQGRRPAPATPPIRAATTPPPEATESGIGVSDTRREDLMQMVLNHRRKDAFDLLGVDPAGFGREFHDRFLEFAQRYAPWSFGDDLTADARRVFLAGVRAYADIADPERRQVLLDRRRNRKATPRTASTAAETFKIETDLLDPEVQYERGRALMAERNYRDAIVQLAFASDLDPQNGDYRAELAYCRFLANPGVAGPPALDELAEALRIDSRSGLAQFYQGDILRRMGRLAEAEEAYRRSIKPMAPDRRPIDALRDLHRGSR